MTTPPESQDAVVPAADDDTVGAADAFDAFEALDAPDQDLPAKASDGELGRVARLKEWGEERRVTLTAQAKDLRGRSPLFDAAARAWEHDTAVGGGLLAGALAFRLFLFMVPFAFVMFTLFGSVATASGASPAEMAHKAGVSGVLASAIVSTADLSAGHRILIFLVALYALISTSRSVVATIVAMHCLVWRVPREKIKKTKPALLFIVFVAVTSTLTNLIARVRAEAPAPGLALTLAWILLPLVSWWWVSRYLPHPGAPTWALLPGACVFALGVQGLHLFTVYYLTHAVSSKSETYGALGIALSVLMWTYVAGRLLTGTALVNATLWRRFTEGQASRGEPLPELAATGSLVSRAAVLGAWVRAAFGLLR